MDFVYHRTITHDMCTTIKCTTEGITNFFEEETNEMVPGMHNIIYIIYKYTTSILVQNNII